MSLVFWQCRLPDNLVKMYLSFGFVEFRLLVQVLARMSWLMASNAVWMKSI